MQLMLGTTLVVFSWAVVSGVLVIMGLPFAHLIITGRSRLELVRRSLWWGLAVAFAVLVTLTLATPLHGSTAGIVFLLAAALLGLLGWLLRKGPRSQMPLIESHSGHRFLIWLPAAVLGALVVYLAMRALGPANNYDTGLYHLGAITYASDYRVIPGIANIFNPLGYSNSMFPFAAMLGNGPWDANGFRLANGLIITLTALDIVLRLMERRFTWGTYVLLIGAGAMWFHLIAISDFWVTSPTSDTAVMLLCLIATAYFVDTLDTSATAVDQSSASSLSILACVLLLSMRPTMVFFAGALIVIVFIQWLGRRRALTPRDWWSLALAGFLAAFIGGVQLVRDYVLSGWLLYPLPVHGFDVPWRATDPWMLRTATLGAARDSGDLWNAATGWDWVPVWALNLRTQWETYLFLLLAGAAIMSYLIARVRTGHWSSGRMLGLAVTPASLALITWFLASPPSFRFIWGPLFTLPIIILASSLKSLAEKSPLPSSIGVGRFIPSLLVITVSGMISVTMGYSLVSRNVIPEGGQQNSWSLGFITFAYETTPIAVPQTSQLTLPTGLQVTMVEQGEQCWDQPPLCAPRIEETVRRLGPSNQDGFAR